MPFVPFQNELFKGIYQRWTGFYDSCVRAYNLNGDVTAEAEIGGVDGTATGLAYSTGKYGILQSGYFDGATSLIDIGSAALLDNLPNFTILAVIYPETDGEANLGKIYSKGVNVRFEVQNQTAAGVQLYGEVQCATTDATALSNTTTGRFPLNTWNMVMMVWDNSTKYVSLYTLNDRGQAVECTYDAQVQGVGGQTADAGDNGCIGNYAATGASFDGMIDSFRLYNESLAAARLTPIIETPLYQTTAPQHTSRPYCTVDLVSGVPLHNWDGTDEEVRIQFSIFVDDSSPSAAYTIGCIVEGIRRTFDNQLIDLDTYNQVICIRDVETMFRYDEVLQATIDYLITAAD